MLFDDVDKLLVPRIRARWGLDDTMVRTKRNKLSVMHVMGYGAVQLKPTRYYVVRFHWTTVLLWRVIHGNQETRFFDTTVTLEGYILESRF